MFVFVMNLCASPNKNTFMDQKGVASFVKGRRKDWQHEVYKSQRSTNLQFGCGDRFIPQRFKLEHIDCNLNYVGKNKEKDILKTDANQRSSYWRQNNFVTALNNSFGIRNTRLLQFSNVQSGISEQFSNYSMDRDWPCKPRVRPMAFPSGTHEMPELCSTFDHNLMDWSSNGQMAVSFGHDVSIWHNHDETTMVFSVKRPRALKYSPNGRYLAIGCTDANCPVLELWKLETSKEFLVADGKYFQKCVESVCCIEWSKDSEKIVCGTNCGLIVILNMPAMRTVHKLRKHHHKISCIRYSPNGHYLATGDVHGDIYIFQGSRYKVLLRLAAKAGGIIFDWHPWSGVDLAISEKSPSSIYIFHVPRREIVAFYQRTDKKILINSINFSKITGELLVNIYKRDNGYPCCEILVLSSLNHVVDVLGHEERGSLFMMWSPDGTRLATAGLDESFSIWNFYPNDKLDAKTKKQKSDVATKPSALKLFMPFK